VLDWILRLTLAAIFFYAGLEKFSDSRLWFRLFEAIGVGQWFRYFTGAVECAGAVLLLIPRTTLVATGLLACTMIGALLVHLVIVGVGPQTVAVAVLIALLCTLGWRQRQSALLLPPKHLGRHGGAQEEHQNQRGTVANME
jgi:putative oxidoreductase